VAFATQAEFACLKSTDDLVEQEPFSIVLAAPFIDDVKGELGIWLNVTKHRSSLIEPPRIRHTKACSGCGGSKELCNCRGFTFLPGAHALEVVAQETADA
jgi:hypothetical protein